MQKRMFSATPGKDSAPVFRLPENVPCPELIVFIIVVMFVAAACSGIKKGDVVLGTFTAEAGDHYRNDTPVRFECRTAELTGEYSDRLFSGSYHLMLYEKGGRRSAINVQWEPKPTFTWERSDGKGALIWILDGNMRKGAKRTFTLVLKKGTPPPANFSVDDIEKRKLLIRDGNRPVLQYNYGIINEVEGQASPFDKSSYLHPVWSPDGDTITGDYSPEHKWQRGIFLAWQKVRFGDIETNFWELGTATGRTLNDGKDPAVINGPVFTEIVAYNKGTVEGRTFFREICTVRLYNRPSDKSWMFDISYRQWPVDPESPDTLPRETKRMDLQKVYYGGMSYRGVSPGWLRYEFIARDKEQLSKFRSNTKWLDPSDSLDILTSEGYTRKNGNGTPARWIDFTGPLMKGWGGLVMFDNPSNKRYPTPLRIHPDMPYFCFAFTKDQPYLVTSDDPLTLSYRAVVHMNHPDREKNESLALDFTEPPVITWNPAH
jgi:hypothetical protein